MAGVTLEWGHIAYTVYGVSNGSLAMSYSVRRKRPRKSHLIPVLGLNDRF